MKKFLVGLVVICTMLFMTNVATACDCGCDRAKQKITAECTKDCDCGCQNGQDCKCAKKECCKKCPCGCKNGENCKCKKGCDKQKCDKEKSLFEEIKDSTATEEITDITKKDCGCKRGEVKTKCKKSKFFRKCKKAKKECEKGCPLKNITK